MNFVYKSRIGLIRFCKSISFYSLFYRTRFFIRNTICFGSKRLCRVRWLCHTKHTFCVVYRRKIRDWNIFGIISNIFVYRF